jgi:hypothetical protein
MRDVAAFAMWTNVARLIDDEELRATIQTRTAALAVP